MTAVSGVFLYFAMMARISHMAINARPAVLLSVATLLCIRLLQSDALVYDPVLLA